VELARNWYDNESGAPCESAVPQAIMGIQPIQHDPAYNTSFLYRGNPIAMKSPGNQACMSYDITGKVRLKSGNEGTALVTTQSSTNYAAPSQITVNGHQRR
jgi:hypothetical protein